MLGICFEGLPFDLLKRQAPFTEYRVDEARPLASSWKRRLLVKDKLPVFYVSFTECDKGMGNVLHNGKNVLEF